MKRRRRIRIWVFVCSHSGRAAATTIAEEPLVRQKGLPFSLSSIALLVCSAPAAVPVAVNSVASLLCNVSANGVCTVFGNTLN